MNARDLALRTALLVGGLTLYGTSMAMMITGGLGLNPWDVFHQGLAARLPISFGAITAVTGVMVLLLWIPLRQRPGIGTVANIVIIAVSVDLALDWLPDVTSIPSRAALLTVGVVLNGLATAAYISAGLGAGPRDGLMTGLVARSGLSVRLVRTAIELAVLGTGWLLGGTAGVGTVLYALAIGPLVHFFLGVMPQKFTAQKFTARKCAVRAGGDHSSVESSEPADRIPTETP
jgi:uncharacterized membrane protein YczE